MKKGKKILSLVLAMIMLISSVQMAASAISNPYPINNYNSSGEWSNCTWSVWKLVYDNFGIALPSWGNAGNWYDNAQNTGYAVGSTPMNNAIVCYPNHVALVTGLSLDGTQIYIKEGGYGDDPNKGYHEGYSAAYGSNIIGYIYLGGLITDSVPDAVTNLKSEKKVYNSKESITFTWDYAYGAQNYWVYLWKDGMQLYSLDCGSNTTFTSAPTSPGNYTLIIRPGNANGFNENSKNYTFIVTDEVPEAVSNLASEKKVYGTDEYITFTWDKSYGTQNYWVYLWKDGVQLYSIDCGLHTSFTSAPTSEGKYTLIIRPGNINGFNENSNNYAFVVTDGSVISFDANGGECKLPQKMVIYNKAYGTLPTAVKEGYNFDGWYTEKIGGKKITAETIVTQLSDDTLYAQWLCNHSNVEVRNQMTATCTELGYTGDEYCKICLDKISVGSFISKANHLDYDNDYSCDHCGEVLNEYESCSCNCHKSGIAKFFFNIILFFQKIFKKNKVCDCGITHY